jgi:membrane-bound lytic murein transglycosylase B
MKLISKVFFVALLVLLPIFSYAQTTETNAQREARLKAELAQVELEQAETEKVLANAQNQTSSLKRDILILDTKIKAAQLNIKAKNLLIESLGKDINKKQQQIVSLEDRIDRGRETLAQIMRKTSEADAATLPEFLLTRDSLTKVFTDIDSFQSVQESLKITFEQIRSDKAQTETEKNTLSQRKNKESDARAVIESEKKNIEVDEKAKQKLLAISKGNELTYSQVLAQKKAKASEIRAALFSLAGGSQAIPFEVALKYANEASKATGIRPAFLLAILTQESSLGKNVGSCYLTDPNTGAGASVKSGTTFPNVMKPTRDVGPFIEITKRLGLDYTKTLVSCPIASAGGWGGAMGPAQFIASTWMLFDTRIASALSVGTPNPWNPEHAFVASSMYLTDLGAYAGSYTGEKNAACKYYSGRSCSASNTSNSYGAQVMSKADIIQRTMIDPLQGL